MSDLSALPLHVRTYLKGYVQRGRRLALLRGVGSALAYLLGVLLAAALADRVVHFSETLRWVALVLVVGGSILLLLRTLWRYTRPTVDWLAAARSIESGNPRLGERLLTVASQLLGPSELRGSDELIDQIAYDLNREVAEERPASLLPSRWILGPWLVVGLMVALVVVLWQMPALELPRLASRVLLPWIDIDPVTTTRLQVVPGDLDVPQGATVRIEVSVQRLGGGPVVLYIAEGTQGDYRRVQMAAERPKAVDRTAAEAGKALSPTTRPSISPPEEPQRYVYTLQSVDRDVRYYVTAGDASSRPAELRVLRRPAVAEIRARYTYPAYTGRAATTVLLPDGRVEAPAQTEVELTVVATEPLAAALIGVAGEKQLMTRPTGAGNERTRVARFVVQRDGRLDIDLISDREQPGAGPASAEVRVVPDRTPLVRLSAGGQTLRLSPRELLPLSYEALDDFGIESLVVRVQLGSQPPQEFPLSTQDIAQVRVGDRRRRAGYVEFDLGHLAWSVGDVATISVVAKDSGGKESITSAADSVTVLASPRSVGLDAYERAAEIDAAAQLAEAAAADLEQAAVALIEADKAGAAGAASTARATRRLNASAGALSAARRALVRAAGRDPSPELSRVMMAWVDSAQDLATSSEALFREAGGDSRSDRGSPRSRGTRGMIGEATRSLSDRAKALHKDLRQAARGERAEATLADLDNLAAVEKRLNEKTPPDRLRQSAQRLREEVQGAAKSLGVGGGTNEMRQKLRQIADEARYTARARSVPDYVTASEEWARQVQRNEWRPITLDERLLAAAQAEAVRPGGDGRIARDYHQAARAASAIEAAADRSRPVPVSPATANAFAAAVRAMVREHRLWTTASQNLPTGDELAAIHEAAEQSRRLMGQWAGDGSELAHRLAAVPATSATAAAISATAPAGLAVRVARAESAALSAGAAASAGRFADAARHDEQVVANLVGGSDLSAVAAMQSMARARVANESARVAAELTTRQSELARLTTHAARNASSPATLDELAAAQNAVAAEAAEAALAATQASGVQWPAASISARDRAGGAYVTVQARLAAIPQQLAEATEASRLKRESAERATAARRAADSAASADKAAANRAAELAARDAAAAKFRSEKAMQVLSAAAAESADALDPSADEAIRETLRKGLGGAVKLMADSAGGDVGDVSRSSAEVLKAVEASQLALAGAQEELARRDPAISSKWFARAAAEALSRRPPDFREAERNQRLAEAALAGVRDASARYAAVQRMTAVRELRPAVSAALPPMAEPAAGDGARPSTPVFGGLSNWLRDWRRLRPRVGEDAAGVNNSDPPGYETQIKAYFEALGKARQ